MNNSLATTLGNTIMSTAESFIELRKTVTAELLTGPILKNQDRYYQKLHEAMIKSENRLASDRLIYGRIVRIILGDDT